MNRVRAIRRFCALAAAAAVALLAACGGGSDKPEPPAVKTGADAAVSPSKSDGKLTKAGSPGRTVISLWRYIQLGAVPAAVLSYDPRVRDRVGTELLAGALINQQRLLGTFSPKIASDERAPGGRLLVVSARSRQGVSQDYAYILRQRGRTWYVMYDTLLDEALRNYATRRNSLIKGSSTRTQQAAADSAARSFRSAALGGRARQGAEQSSPPPAGP
jgi:hypothetical protein